jgi:hypothetical protein
MCGSSAKICLGFIALLYMVSGMAQTGAVSFTPEDRSIFERLILGPEGEDQGKIGELVVATGKELLNTPYVAGTLEVQRPEILIVNFRGLDCTTFVENVLVVGGMIQDGQTDWDIYLGRLEQVRYRDGKLKGYPSRLHYFTDWIRNNAKKGLVEDITQKIGGAPYHKNINFKGTHPKLYPALSAEADLGAIQKIEEELSDEFYYILPKQDVAKTETKIQNGDIIALATDLEGLDVTHTGFAYIKENGRVHLLHASTRGSVEISKSPLAEYLLGVKGNTGIIVVRPLGKKD